MGISSSTNTVNSMLDNVNNVFTTYENICKSSENEVNTVFNVGNGCDLENDKITLNNYQAVSQSCIQNNTLQASIVSDVEQVMRQAATAVTQQISFPSVSSASAFINQSVTVGNQIATYYVNECIGQGLQSNQTFNCQGGTIKNSVIEINSFQSLTQQCLSNNQATIALANKLVSQLDQSTSATQQNTFAYFMLVVVLFIGIIAWAGISVADNPLVQWLIVGLVLMSVVGSVIYTVTARSNGSYPYTKSK